MATPASGRVSYEQYVEDEVHGDTKHEWVHGVVYAMAGGSIEHSRLAANIGAALRAGLGGCDVYQSDAMIFVVAADAATYADVAVVCGPTDVRRVAREGRTIGEALLNPTIVVEVLLEGTETYDRGEKFGYYMQIPSLREYVLVAQREACIEVFRRPLEGGRWAHEKAGAGGSIAISGAPIAIDDIYRRAATS
ncbi:MAG TPA: Uma2 family endonuclease [Kofleriaceae bacterium]